MVKRFVFWGGIFFSIWNVFSIKAEEGWKLVWSDEFDGPEIDMANWSMETGRGTGGNWGTGQVDYSTSLPQNIRIEDGILKLTLRNDGAPDGDKNRPYTSARLISQGKQEFMYGRIEARLKGISGQGLGFAFWLLGVDTKTVGWPKCGEIDIAEITGRSPGFNIGTAHYKESWGHGSNQGRYTLPDNGSFEDDFHVFGIEWTRNYIKWYIDDEVYHTFDISGPINDYRPFATPFFIILSIGVGGNYSGPPDATTIFPKTAEIDWVRVYQQDNTPPKVSFRNLELFESLGTGSYRIELDATDQENNLEKVDFFINNSLKQSFTEPPFVYDWNNVTDGCYKLTAIAKDKLGELSETAFSYVRIGNGCESVPYAGSPTVLPGRIEAEHFDKGKNGFAYYDADNKNTGGAFRTSEEVDIEACHDDGGGYVVASTVSPEFLTYTVRVRKASTYTLTLRTSGNETDSLLLTMPNSGVKRKIILNPTEGWSITVVNDIFLNAGDDLLRIDILRGGHKLNWMEFTDTESGLNEQHATATIRIFPNPVEGKGNILCAENTRIREGMIYTLSGKLVKNIPLSGVRSEHYSFSTEGLIPGIYMVYIVTEDGNKESVLLNVE